MKHQVEQSTKMQELQPQLTKLQEKYKKDTTKLQQAQVALYKEHKINPGFGCLVLLIQLPIFIGLYSALQLLVTNGTAAKAALGLNKLVYFSFLKISSLEPAFFGFDLTKFPNQWQKIGWWYLLIPILTGALQFYQSYLTGKTMPTKVKAHEDKTVKLAKKGEKVEKKEEESDMQTIMQKQMMFLMPAMIAWFSYGFPVGLALYWNIFTLFGIFQYLEQIKMKKAREALALVKRKK